MPYQLKVAQTEVFGAGKYKNASGNTECAEFVRQATGAPDTTQWRKSPIQVMTAKPGQIASGTAIATFDEAGRYPTDALGKHAAIYLSHDDKGIRVLDQWNSQGEVRARTIWFSSFKKPVPYRRSNDGDTFWVIQ